MKFECNWVIIRHNESGRVYLLSWASEEDNDDSTTAIAKFLHHDDAETAFEALRQS